MNDEFEVVWNGKRGSESLCSDLLIHSTLASVVEEDPEVVRHRHKKSTSGRQFRRTFRQSTLDAAKAEIRERHGR